MCVLSHTTKTLHSFRCSKHCFVVATILNKQIIRNKTKTNNNPSSKQSWQVEALTPAPVLIDQVWYGWCYSRQQSVEEDHLHGLLMWCTLGSLDDPTERNQVD